MDLQSAAYRTKARKSHISKSSGRIVGLAAVTGLVAGTGLLLPENPQEKVRHAVAAAQRTGRVLVTLAQCIEE